MELSNLKKTFYLVMNMIISQTIQLMNWMPRIKIRIIFRVFGKNLILIT